VWDADNGAQLLCLQGHEWDVRSVACSPDGRRIVSGGWDKTVRVWDAQSGEQLLCLQGHEGGVESVAYSPDGQRIVSAANDKTVRVWDAQSGECVETTHESTDVRDDGVDPDVPWLAIASVLETAIRWQPTGEIVAWFPTYLSDITLHPSGRMWVATVTMTNDLYLIALEGA
jgi:WD40 repeat protein